MDDWADQTRSLMVRLNRSISGTCSLLDTQSRDMTISDIYAHIGSNSLSACMRVILKPRCRYRLWTCVIPLSMLFIFRFLIILTVANIMCRDMVFRKPMPLICMGSHHRVKLLYLSRMTLGKFGTIIGSTCWILWWTILPWIVVHWVHKCPHPSRHILVKLGGSAGCYYQPRVGFASLVG